LAHTGEEGVHGLLDGAADIGRLDLDVPAQVRELQHRQHAVHGDDGDAVDHLMARRRQFRIRRQAVDVRHREPGIFHGAFDGLQRVGGEGNVRRARDFRESHAAYRDLAPVLPHGRHFTSRNCGSVMSSFSGWKTTSTGRPTFASVYSASSRLPAISAPGASSSSTMMLAYGTAEANRLSPT